MHSAYLYVFDADISLWNNIQIGTILGLFVLGSLGGVAFASDEYRRLGGVLLAFFLIGAVAVIIWGLVVMASPNPYKTQIANMDANLKQKYGATLAPPTADSYAEETLIKPTKYELTLPNGKTGTYTIQWDKNTNEPTILDDPAIPTPDQMNQNANKH